MGGWPQAAKFLSRIFYCKEGLNLIYYKEEVVMSKKATELYHEDPIKWIKRGRIHQENAKKRRQDNKAMFIAELGGKCVKCGQTDVRVLEFDHVAQETKSVNVTAIMTSKDQDRIRREVLKCQLLCCNCHKIKSLENGELGRKRKYPEAYE
jgi:hypothetical protein